MDPRSALDGMLTEAPTTIGSASNLEELDRVERALLGKDSTIGDVRRSMGSLDAGERPAVGATLKKVGFAIASKVGGVSGPIWGTAFLRAAAEAGDRTELTGEELIAVLRAAVAGIMHRGEASLGDKTLLDALVPAVDSLEGSLADPSTAEDHGVAALQAAADVAVSAAEATKPMLALRGRAAYTGERSRGSVDAGATAIGVILQDISAAWREKYTDPTEDPA